MGKKLTAFASSEFEKAIGKLTEEVFAADLNYQLYHRIVGEINNHKRAYFRTQTLWGFILDSLLSQAILTLCRIYDGSNYDVNSLERVLRRLLIDNIPPESDNLFKDIDLVSEDDPFVKTLRNWRNNVLAHTNMPLGAKAKNLPKGFIPHHEDLRVLIDRAGDILSRYGESFVAINTVDLFVPKKEVEFVFQSVDEQIKCFEASMRTELENLGLNPDVFLDEEKQMEEIFRINNLV